MLEKAIAGSRRYWTWVACLVGLVAIGVVCYLRQLDIGLGVTGLGRDVTWGLYIAQFTFFVGVAASAVMVVLPYYLHDFHAFARITILGEFLAIAAVVTCGLFIFVDLGQPMRALNVLIYASPGSMMFWDMLSLAGYLLLNVVITRVMLGAEAADVAPPAWIRPVIVVSIPWAISIHTVTAFLYNGLPGRSLWLTAILAPRFLVSAFAAGPALLILLAMLLRRVSRFDAGVEAIRRLALIVTYAMVASVFFMALEIFTVFYSQIPGHMAPFRYLYVGLDGRHALVPWTWMSVVLAAVSLTLLLSPRLRKNDRALAVACFATFVSLWIDKGLTLIVGGFVPSPLEKVIEYLPTMTEVGITVGIWAVGALVVTAFFKIALGVRGLRAQA
jgi:molybdopterin-containing oxidoreductase family membrane subunit